jgi:hypothetical protein
MLGAFLQPIAEGHLCDQATKSATLALSHHYRGEAPNPLGLIFGFHLLQLDGQYADPVGTARRVSETLLSIDSRRPRSDRINLGLLAFAHLLRGFATTAATNESPPGTELPWRVAPGCP